MQDHTAGCFHPPKMDVCRKLVIRDTKPRSLVLFCCKHSQILPLVSVAPESRAHIARCSSLLLLPVATHFDATGFGTIQTHTHTHTRRLLLTGERDNMPLVWGLGAPKKKKKGQYDLASEEFNLLIHSYCVQRVC